MRTLPFVVLLGALACNTPEPPPPAPIGVLNPPGVGTGIGVRRDGGAQDIDLPDGIVDADMASLGCQPVEPGALDNRVSVTLGGEAIDFTVRSAVAYYDPSASCSGAERNMLLLLSSTPSCDIRVSPYLAVVVDADQIGSVIPVGSSIAFALRGAVSIFLSQPGPTGSITYANCTDTSDGTIRFTSLDEARGDQAFELDGTLVTCSGAVTLVQISAAFRAPLEAPFEDACSEP